ncbi:GNAT family N-acetyltransferase [Caulobacter sp. S45]|uniref:GNAT family N-acetyltransferase n=1 Tax=Caulobacter sp. S45 TaxID=1641861 RepID=UPI001575056E|nr:GNAT family N-acetyltransferase [Caulobacter sp. S45]
MAEVTDNTARGRFELTEAGEVAFADYRRDVGRLVIPHVEAPISLRGTGAAGRLMKGVLSIARREGLQVVPLCSYAAAYIRRNAEHQDLLG